MAYNPLIDGLCKDGITYNALIGGLCKGGRAYSALIGGLYKGESMDDAKLMHYAMVE